MPETSEPELIFYVKRSEAPKNFQEYWDTYWIFIATTTYKDVHYRAWGTDVKEAKQKVLDLIAQDKMNGTRREKGQVVE